MRFMDPLIGSLRCNSCWCFVFGRRGGSCLLHLLLLRLYKYKHMHTSVQQAHTSFRKTPTHARTHAPPRACSWSAPSIEFSCINTTVQKLVHVQCNTIEAQSKKNQEQRAHAGVIMPNECTSEKSSPWVPQQQRYLQPWLPRAQLPHPSSSPVLNCNFTTWASFLHYYGVWVSSDYFIQML